MKTITLDTNKSVQILHLYNSIPRQIADRKLELLTPFQITDENIGGGKGGKISNPTEDDVMVLCDDEILEVLYKIENKVNKVCKYFKDVAFNFDQFIGMLDDEFS